MFQVTNETLSGYQGSEIPYTLIQQQGGSDTLVIILPGMGYTVQKPLLHYSTHLFLIKKCDVLLIKYDYQEVPAFKESTAEEKEEWLCTDVRTVIDRVTGEHTYANYVLLGKSVGTRAMIAELTERELFCGAQAIWLTPLLTRTDGYFEKLLNCRQRGLCVIGDSDQHYHAERFDRLAEQPHLHTMLVPETDHSLDVPHDPLRSIEVLAEVIREIERFAFSAR